MDEVELNASGYEWTCVNCNAPNTEIEVSETVQCRRCGKIHRVDDCNHAYP